MNTKIERLLMLSLTALSLAACAPARHSTSLTSAELAARPETFSPPGGEDFEFPVFEEETQMTGNERPGDSIPLLDSQGRKPAAWDGRAPDAAKFTELTEKALDTWGGQILEIIPRDIETFCPKYAALGREARKGFWLMLISAMAKFESGFRTVVFFKEDFSNSKGEPVVSRGLLQISSESANGFGCGIEREVDLHDPAVNLACAVRILNRTVTRDGVITARDDRWHGGARYWSVLRMPRTLNPIQKTTRSIASCT
ncbi:MAG: hypothetical protein V4760_01700 [Bdellovibrionota bacterium]